MVAFQRLIRFACVFKDTARAAGRVFVQDLSECHLTTLLPRVPGGLVCSWLWTAESFRQLGGCC